MRQQNAGGNARVRNVVVNLDRDVETLGQLGHHVVTEHAYRGQVERQRLVQPVVDIDNFLGVHAQTAIDDGDVIAVLRHAAEHRHSRCRRRIGDGVLDEFGKQVHHTVHVAASDRDVFHVGVIDALVVVDLREGPANDVGDLNRSTRGAHWLVAGEHQQRFGLAAHTGGQGVETEQVLQRAGVTFVAFQLGDKAEGSEHQALVATSDGDEVLTVVSSGLHLLCCHTDGRRLHGVEGRGQLTDLVLRIDREHFKLRHLVVGTKIVDSGNVVR